MKKRLYLHIGTTKTGTSALQVYLRDNRAWLQQQGYLYPSSEHYNHRPLAQSIVQQFTKQKKFLIKVKGDCETLWQQFHDEVNESDCSVVLVSCEYFRNLYKPNEPGQSKEMIRWLGQQLTDFDVHVVCYFRNLGDYVKSEYKQVVKDGLSSMPLSAFIDDKIASESPIVSPVAFLDFFAGEFGRENLLIRHYDRSKLIGGNTVDDFLDLVGLPPREDKSKNALSNPSLADEVVDLKRLFNGSASAPRRVSHSVGYAMARQPLTAFGTCAPDNEKAACAFLSQQHTKLAEQYGLDLGDVNNPFAGAPDGPIDNQGTLVMLCMVWKEVHSLRNEIKKYSNEVGQLHKQIPKKPATMTARILKFSHRVCRYSIQQLRQLKRSVRGGVANGGVAFV